MRDIHQVREFIRVLTGSSSSVVAFQTFYDPKPPHPQRPDLATTWTSTLDQSVEFIQHRQDNQCGIYMSVNGTDWKGREEENIVDLRVLFADFDGRTEPEWVLTPHLIQKRDETHGHAFWLIDAGNLSHDEWSCAQKQLAMYYGTDEQVIDPARVVRLPGTVHFKDPSNPACYEITEVNNHARYSVTDFLDAHPLSEDLNARYEQWSTARKGIMDGVGYEHHERDLNNVIGFISHAAYPAVDGEGGTHELYRVAGYGHDHGIPLQTMQDLLWEHYNPRCEPPWSERGRGHFNQVVYRAYKYALSAPGCKTIRSHVLSMPPIPEPECGWDDYNESYKPKSSQPDLTYKLTTEDIEQARLSGHRLNKDEALVVVSTLDGKAPHYDFARSFDGTVYDGCQIIRFDKEFYVYGLKGCHHWKKVSDEVIKSQVQRMLSPYKPADSMTSGVFRCLCDLVTVDTVENGTWLTDRDRNTRDYAVFTNGIVDLGADNPVLLPHTYEYFTFNELPYAYELGASCPQWKAFLTSIWDNDEDLKCQLQQWMGYCLTRDVSLQKYATLMGKPRAGKGVITDVISNMVGSDNVTGPSLSNLIKDSALDRMSTAAVTLIPDAHSVNHNTRDAVLSNFKAITGEDMVSFHRMYKGGVNTIFRTKIIMSTNNVPDFNDPSGALVSRMLVFPFWKSFEQKPDPRLREKLASEIEGILQWAIAGLRDLRNNDGVFTESRSGRDEKEEIREDMFPLSQFISEMCTLEPGAFTLVDDLYAGYRMWAMTNGVKSPMTRIGFGKCLRNSSLPISHVKNGKERGFSGVSIQAIGSNNVVGFPAV